VTLPKPSPITPDTFPASSPIASTHFFTTNEFVCFTDLGYKSGKFAPGLKIA